MAITGNKSVAILDIGTSDTTLITAPTERMAVEAMVLHNETGAGVVTVEVFISPDTTSAAGTRIAKYAIAVDASVDVSELIGQGFSSSEYIIGKADVTGAVVKSTITEYTAGS